VVARALLDGGEASGVFFEALGGGIEDEFESHLLDLFFEAVTGERVLDLGVVVVGLSQAAADAGDDLCDTRLVEVISVGDFLMGEVSRTTFLKMARSRERFCPRRGAGLKDDAAGTSSWDMEASIQGWQRRYCVH
jgi:hypothetical protein